MNIKAIAKIAGVSISTVSRAINNQPRISVRTKKRILEIVEREGFFPDNIAQSLKTKKTKTIGIIVPEIKNRFYYEIIDGIGFVLNKNKFNIILCESRSSKIRELKNLSMLLSKKVDGIIIAPISEISEGVNLIHKKKIPFVVIDILQKNKKINTIYFNHYDISNQATKYLIENKHREILIIDTIRSPKTESEFIIGYKDAMKSYNIPILDYYIQETSPTILGGYKVVKELIQKRFPFTAIIVIYDYIAFGIYKVLDGSGLKIPQDTSIIGNTDTLLSRYINPPLTTFRQPKFKLGYKSAEILLDNIKNLSSNVKNILLPSKFIIRKSVIKRDDV